MNDIVYAGQHTLMHSVLRHSHNSWEFVYCTFGEGAFRFQAQVLPYRQGDVVVIPPNLVHSNSSESGFRNIHINMVSPTLTLTEPTIIRDDSQHFLLDAFTAALYHFHADHSDSAPLLAAYGNLITCILSSYHTGKRKSKVVEDIAQHILSHWSDCDFELDAYLHSLPFSYDYLRKLFQKEMGVTPLQYLGDKRLQIAADILINPNAETGSMADLAMTCGFREPLYFSRMFKKKFGVAPSYYAEFKRSETLLAEDNVKVLPQEDDAV